MIDPVLMVCGNFHAYYWIMFFVEFSELFFLQRIFLLMQNNHRLLVLFGDPM